MPDNEVDKPVTRQGLDEAFTQLFAAFEQRILDRTQEYLRDLTTELLRGLRTPVSR